MITTMQNTLLTGKNKTETRQLCVEMENTARNLGLQIN
jgi:hypothetical protein